MTVVLHVSPAGSDQFDGTADFPFRTINHAATLARPGDTVLVRGGEYREWVQPRRGGVSDERRITFEAADGEHVIIKGSERLSEWVPVSGTVWKATVPNALFGDFNPFDEPIDGDWIVYTDSSTPRKHLGDVYLNGLSFYEASALDGVFNPPGRTQVLDDWTGSTHRVHNPAQTQLLWFAEVGAESTTVWANFQ